MFSLLSIAFLEGTVLYILDIVFHNTFDSCFVPYLVIHDKRSSVFKSFCTTTSTYCIHSNPAAYYFPLSFT